ncbi:SigE family RNA polymerase sigma factor [uncultured Jatrophihabitans sp.]|uniref:SigE family RNA polymerase sigma factor n=1 Tax=uncultured Jatrophihabitans sp. TaxID=1610747 RepID=UPI0035CA58D5
MTFEAFVEQQGAALLRLAFVLTGDHHAAEDLTQTALADMYRHWRRVSAARSPQAYARRVLVNAFVSGRRRRWTSERPVEVQDHHLPPVTDPAAGVALRETLRARVAELPLRSRTVLVLRFWADLDDHAIADAMGTTPSTVRATAARALAALRSDGTADLEDAR